MASPGNHRCKKTFFTFFILFTFFKIFLTFFLFPKLFLFKKIGKVQSTCKNLKFNGFINNRILYPVIRM